MGFKFSYAAPLNSFGGPVEPWHMPGAWLEDHLVPSPTDAQILPIAETSFPGEEYPPTGEEHFLTGAEDASSIEECYPMIEGHSPTGEECSPTTTPHSLSPAQNFPSRRPLLLSTPHP